MKPIGMARMLLVSVAMEDPRPEHHSFPPFLRASSESSPLASFLAMEQVVGAAELDFFCAGTCPNSPMSLLAAAAAACFISAPCEFEHHAGSSIHGYRVYRYTSVGAWYLLSLRHQWQRQGGLDVSVIERRT